jgi:hypothetical protein
MKIIIEGKQGEGKGHLTDHIIPYFTKQGRSVLVFDELGSEPILYETTAQPATAPAVHIYERQTK